MPPRTCSIYHRDFARLQGAIAQPWSQELANIAQGLRAIPRGSRLRLPPRFDQDLEWTLHDFLKNSPRQASKNVAGDVQYPTMTVRDSARLPNDFPEHSLRPSPQNAPRNLQPTHKDVARFPEAIFQRWPEDLAQLALGLCSISPSKLSRRFPGTGPESPVGPPLRRPWHVRGTPCPVRPP